jgi:predicted ATPase
MLTKLEIRGFKNLLDVQVEFGPFTCIAGANGMGKSNVFDAIEFLSYLASEPLAEASQRVRGASGMRGGDPRDLSNTAETGNCTSGEVLGSQHFSFLVAYMSDVLQSTYQRRKAHL